MKCENCGKNEVTFVYQSNINGRVTEKHLCAECAEKLGYSQKIAAQSRRMMQGMQSLFNEPFLGGGLDSFFRPMGLLGSGDGFFGRELFDDFFADMPALGAGPEQAQAAEPEHQAEGRTIDISGEEQSRFARMRQLNQLRIELKKAVHREEFERAAELRDQIRALEAEKKTGK